MTCKCGHHERYHVFGPGKLVSCGKVNCQCGRYEKDDSDYQTTVKEMAEVESLAGSGKA